MPGAGLSGGATRTQGKTRPGCCWLKDERETIKRNKVKNQTKSMINSSASSAQPRTGLCVCVVCGNWGHTNKE